MLKGVLLHNAPKEICFWLYAGIGCIVALNVRRSVRYRSHPRWPGSPSFAYTFGLFDTCGLPEIIEVGLRHETAFALLNAAAGRLREGVKISQGRHRGLLPNVECEFRPVDPKWARRLMLGATWFYEGAEFPVLQAVYPDLENRFPEDASFDLNFAQPLLQKEKSFDKIEEDFWNAHSPTK